MVKITKGWPPERRAKQAENCRKSRPWEQIKGSKSAEGKQNSATNALKNGYYTADMKAIRALLTRQKKFIKEINTDIRNAHRNEKNTRTYTPTIQSSWPEFTLVNSKAIQKKTWITLEFAKQIQVMTNNNENLCFALSGSVVRN